MRSFSYLALLVMMSAIVVAQNRVPPWSSGSQEKMCGLGTYYDSVKLAVANATDQRDQTLMTLLVLPSFRPEYAFVLKQDGTEIKAMRATFQDQLWKRLGPPLHVPNTRPQCLELAASAKTDDRPPDRGANCRAVMEIVQHNRPENRRLSSG